MQDGKPVVIGTSYELRDRNQSLIIKLLKPEHGGTYSCVVRNEVGVVKAEGAVTITGKNKDSEVTLYYILWTFINYREGVIGSLYKHLH